MNVTVIGGSQCSKKVYAIAHCLGGLIAREGWTVICGGHHGVMEAVCCGAQECGGITVGILPEYDDKQANDYLTVKLPTGIGYARNFLVIRSSEIVIAIGGKYGTLSEIAFALSEGKFVIGIGTWGITGIKKVAHPQEVIRWIKKYIKEKGLSKKME